MTYALLILGLAALVLGAEWLVRGASRLAGTFGVPPLVVGLTVVAFGTGAPEMAVSVEASMAGRGAVAVGNVVGSNIANILLVLGAAAAVAPIPVTRRVIRVDVPVMVAVCVLFWALAANGNISRLEGLGLLSASILYTVWLIRQSRWEPHTAGEEEWKGDPRHISANVLRVIAGLVVLVLGAGLVVDSASGIARALGVSELMVALTIVAAGTSLPEVVTSVVAAARGHRDIAVGNVLGSNILNLLAVMGVSAALSGNGVTVPRNALRTDIPVMVFVAALSLPVVFNGRRVTRIEGGMLLTLYGLYVVHLALRGSGHPAASSFNAVAVVAASLATAALLVSCYRCRFLAEAEPSG